MKPWRHRLLDRKTDYPAVHLTWEGQGLLFDCGEGSLTPREVHKLAGIFLSHLHIDHFLGFDRIISHAIDCPRAFRVFGPQGTAAGVQSKLRAYTWNLVGGDALRFEVTDLSEGSRQTWAMSVPHAMELRPLGAAGPGLDTPVLVTPDWEVTAALLDHRTPSLAYAFREHAVPGVDMAAVDALGLPPGPWLARLKEAAGQPEAELEVGGRVLKVREVAHVLRANRARTLVYATDLRFEPGNVERLAALAAGADALYLEANFLDEVDKAFASSHLTAGQAGEIAARAGVGELVLLHHSRKYRGREREFIAEAARRFQGPVR